MRFFIITLLILIISPAFSQEHYIFSPIDSNDGLSENRVRCITQLPDGRIMIMTDGLVNLYNGTSFQYLHINDENVYPLTGYHGYHHSYIDSEGRLWIKDYQRLLLFDIKKEYFVLNLDSVLLKQGIDEHLSDFFVDSDHNLWYLTQNDDLIFHDANNKETFTFVANVSLIGDKNDKLFDLAIYGDQVFLFYKSGLMICYSRTTRKELFRNNPLEGKRKEAYDQIIFVIPDNDYLYQIRNGNAGILLRYDIKKNKWETVLEQNYWLSTLSLDNKGNIWLSCQEGLWYIDKALHKKKHVSELRLIDGRIFKTSINILFNDNQGGLWLGTTQNGLLYYHPDRFKFKNIGRSLFKIEDGQEFRVNCFVERNDDILLGTPIGLFKYSKDTEILSRFTEIPYNMQCYVMIKDRKNRIWVCAAHNGLYRIDNNSIKHYTFQQKAVFYIYENPDGSLFLCLGEGFGTLEPETGEYKEIDVTRKMKVIYQMTEYEDNSLIGISDAGVFIYDRESNSLQITGTYEIERPAIFHQNNFRYNSVFSDSRGLIWLGTRDGLSVWNPKEESLKSFHSEDGLVNNRIQSISEDYQNNIWISTSNGISRIEVNLNTNTYSFSNFNRYDGVIANEFFERSVYRTASGSLLWGGIDGFNEIASSNIDNQQQLLPKPLFTKLLLFNSEIKQGERYNGNLILNQSVASTNELILSYNQNFITFEFSALNYINPTQTFYRFQLEGIDEKFQEIAAVNGIGQANYTNLSPGVYILKVYSGNNNKKWSSEYAEMKIIINPPFWKTPLAYILYTLLFLFIFYFITSFYLKQKKNKIVRQQKEDLDRIKFRFFTNVSHELRTPLTLIITPLDSLLKKMDDSVLKNQLSGIHRNANELLRIVNQLLDFRKLELTGETLKLTYCNICEFIESACSPFELLTQNKGIRFEYKYNTDNLYAYIDKDKLHKIINNLLSNAYKFTPKGGNIILIANREYFADEQKDMLSIKVTDTGNGIPEKELPNIFSRFYQASNQDGQNTGSGIGLHLVQEYVQLHGGSIRVDSQLNKGSVFTIYIPMDLQPESKDKQKEHSKIVESKLKLLIVEDNCEFREFLSEQLAEYYSIVKASDGMEGLEKAKEILPDLIISDIMMPQIDGVELCKLLKKDVQTSHIPVVLLTARSSDEAQIEGYESGADAYISKPFNMDILLLRIHNLIEQQKQRKELFKKAIVIQPESITSTSIDEKFIRNALECVDKNLSNSLYSVEQFSKDMNMDRTGLYRKMIAIIGQSPTVFIRSIRLKKAAQLLKQGLTVSEVSDMVGFGTISYFSKCFQEEFGVKPSQYEKI